MSVTNIGKRFSHVYLERGDAVGDSPRMRMRLQATIIDLPRGVRDNLSSAIERELGVQFHSWRVFFDNAAMRDVLDFVTVVVPILRSAERSFMASGFANTWLAEIKRIFLEENLHYTFDERGGAHFSYDKEFTQNNAATIKALQPARYSNFLDAFSQSLAALAKAPPDGKAAIRATFAALEGLLCLMFPDIRRLSSGVAGRLDPLIIDAYPGNRRAQEAAGDLISALRGWIDAAHHYRHEEGTKDEVAQPPLTLAVYLVSSGAAHLRWVAELDDRSKAD
jgi:hypothetical protein